MRHETDGMVRDRGMGGCVSLTRGIPGEAVGGRGAMLCVSRCLGSLRTYHATRAHVHAHRHLHAHVHAQDLVMD